MTTKAYVSSLPDCDIHKYDRATPGVPAKYDGRTRRGPWANMCGPCFEVNGVGLGTGRGQELIVGEPPVRSDAEVSQAILAAMEAGNFDAALEACGDRDPAEFL